MSRRSRAAVARSAAGDRTLTTLIGVVLLAAGVLAVLVGTGVLGGYRAERPLLDPIAIDWAGSHVSILRWILVAAGVVLFVLGLWWALRSLRIEPQPDVLLSVTPGERVTVEHSAIADAVRADAETIEGVSRSRVRLVGTSQRPAIRLYLWLQEGADVRDVWADVDGRVLARAREAFGVSALPTAVRIELESRSVETARVQ